MAATVHVVCDDIEHVTIGALDGDDAGGDGQLIAASSFAGEGNITVV